MAESRKVLELKKHVAVIHSSNKLSLLQRKIANALLFNAYDHLMDRDEHEIHINTLCKLIGYDSKDYKTIKRSLVNLLSTVLEWNLVDGDRLDTEGVWNASSIIADASIAGPICTYSYSNRMRQLLYRPNMYGRLDMRIQARFQSSYGLALYENCNRFKDVGRSPWFDIAKFRKLMGIEEGKYKIFRDFKTRVLDKAVEEVNKYSPISVLPQLRKQNRQVVAIQFVIQQSNGISALVTLNAPDQCTLTETLKTHFGFSKKQIEETLANYDEQYIREKIAIIEVSGTFKKGQIKNLAKYLLSAIKDDYQATKSSRVVNAHQENSSPPTTIQAVPTVSLEAYRRAQNKKIIIKFNELDKKKQKQLLKDFQHSLGRSMYLDVFLRDGLKNVLVQDQLCLFLRQISHEVLAAVPTYETWLASEVMTTE